MSTCTYTWKEWDGAKRKYIEKKCQKEIWEGSDEFCIFHDPSLEKDVDLFKEKLEEQMQFETERNNFFGYYFPEKWDFFGKKFKINADFREATFQGTANFREATFQGTAYFREATFLNADFEGAIFQDACFEGATFQDANFEGATFQDACFEGAIFQGTADFREATFQDADFREATFQGTADFWGAIFQNADFMEVTFQNADFLGAIFQDAYFEGATFQNADFSYTTVKESLEFNPKEVSGITDFRGAKFFFSGVITLDLERTEFHRAYLQNVAFVDCVWPDNYEIYEEKYMKDEDINLTFNELETIYRDLKQNMQNHGDYSKAGEFYYREMEMKQKGASKIKERIGLKVYKYLAGYGERYWNTAAVSGSIIFFFAFLYGITDCLQYSVKNPCLYQEIIDVVYFSFVTFTTLGLGDITPLTTLGKVLICLEAVIGAFMIAVFVVVFVRKMAR